MSIAIATRLDINWLWERSSVELQAIADLWEEMSEKR